MWYFSLQKLNTLTCLHRGKAAVCPAMKGEMQKKQKNSASLAR